MRFAFRFRTALVTACLLAALVGSVHAEDDRTHSIEQKNAPPPTPENTSAPGAVHVTANVFDRDSHYVGGGGVIQSYSAGSLLRAGAYTPSNTTPTISKSKDKSGCQNHQGDPIILNSGDKVVSYPLFSLPGEMGLKFELFYNTSARSSWGTNFDYFLDNACTDSGDGLCHYIKIYRPDGSTLKFSAFDPLAYTTWTQGAASLTHNADGTYTLQDEDALTEVYSSTGQTQSITDSSGIGWTFSYTTGTNAGERITHTDGQSIAVAYGPLTETQQNGTNVFDQVVTVTDPAGNVYTLDYGNAHATNAQSSDLASITYPGSPATVVSFNYVNLAPYGDRLSEIDYNGTPYAYTTYVPGSTSPYGSWASGTQYADGTGNTTMSYGINSAGNLTVAITNPLGHVTTNTYAGINNQLTSVSDDAVSDCGATVNSRTYDSNGNLSQIVDNNGITQTYSYAASGQLQTETEAAGTSLARTTDYVWDPNLQLNRPLSVTVEGWSKTVYTYNAQNRLASVAVTNLSGNGSSGQTLTTLYNYTLYANGMVQTMSVTHPSPGNTDTDVSTYDTLGNLSSFANGLGQTTTYSNYNGLGEVGRVVGPNGDTTDYTYDARGRVATKTTYPNGTAAVWNYAYDGFGLLASVSAPDNEMTTWSRNAEMLLTSITHNDKDGVSTESFGYDANGDVTSHTVTRGSDVGLSESASYDALGRLYQKQGMHGQSLTYAYDGNGNVVSVTNAAGHTVSNQYDALNRVTKTVQSGGASPPMPSTAPTLNEPSSSATGSYTVSWTSITGATTYLLQEQVNGGSWNTIQNSSAISWATSGKANATYGYRVRGCNVTGCGPWSGVGATTVLYPPGTPILSVPTTNNTGSYTASWSSVGTATSYTLQEQVNGGAWTTVQSSGATSWSATGKANNTYSYQVQACNGSGCSGWSAVSSVAVLLPPGAAPTLTAPSSNGSGSYTVSWTSVATATSYTLQQQINGGSWTTAQSTSALSWNASGESNGTYAYRVAACDAGGCSAWSSTSTTTVLLPPGSPPSVSSPSTNSTGSYTVSWSTITNATSYTLQEQVNGGGWTTVQSSGATTWSATSKANGTYGYQAQSCNSGGCSAWSSVSTTTVLHPPGSAPALTVPGSSTTGSYTVSWTGVSTATSYTLQEQVNGGGWNTVQSNSATSWGTSGRGNGTYGYQVQACNASGCGPWSGVGSTTVLLPPGSAPSLSVPGSNGTGSYTVSWTGVSTATSYTLQEQVNGGGWGTVQSSSAISWGTSGRGNGTYGYQVQACNASGCGPWSGVESTTVLLPPGSAPSLSVPGSNGTGSYTVSWGGVSTASSYTLQEQVNGGSWSTVQASGATSWSASGHATGTYGYKVQACNTGGCGPWSGTGTVTVTIPVPIAINGNAYDAGYLITSGKQGYSTIGFAILSGNTWEVYGASPAGNVVKVSGAVPSTAVSVQYTWTNLGPPAGDVDSGGTLTNNAASWVAVSSNPGSYYTTSTVGATSGSRGRSYQLQVNFLNAAGANVSSSTCTMTAETEGSN